MLINNLLKRAKDDHDLMLLTSPIQSLVNTLMSAQKVSVAIEDKLSGTLSSNALIRFCDQLIEILTNEIADPEQLNRIRFAMISAMRDAQQGDDDDT